MEVSMGKSFIKTLESRTKSPKQANSQRKWLGTSIFHVMFLFHGY
jgi:hypothetical protein